MAQSVYSKISKKIGFNGRANYPSIEQATELLEKVKNADEYAFETVFRIWRFAPSPEYQNATTVEAFNLISDAFKIGTCIFQNKQTN